METPQFQFKNQYLALIAMAIPFVMQYAEPMIDKLLGRDKEQIAMVLELIEQERDHRDSLWQQGVAKMLELDTGLNSVKVFLETKQQTEGNETFAIGLRGKHGTDSLWYRASDGHLHEAVFEPAVMWYKYRDGWEEKAVTFEIDWEIFTMMEQTITE